MKYINLILCIFSVGLLLPLKAQYKTRPFKDNIKTVQTRISGESFSSPLIDLNGNKQIIVSFDEMSHDLHNYYYSIEHCNADWTPSSISPIEFATGFTTNIPITDITMSQNTTYNYTHYSLTLPNDDLKLKISGNYVVSIYEDNNTENKVATACFSIVDSKVSVDATVRGNTDIDILGKMQQLDFNIIPGSYKIDNPISDLKIYVQQNGRFDNRVSDLSPTYTSSEKLSYINKALIFEGGNEYYSIDFSSIYAYSERINRIRLYSPYYHVELLPDKIDPSAKYNYYKEANGKYIVNIQQYDNDDYQADYMLVHFSLPTENPFLDGQIYLLGDFNYNLLDNNSLMIYNNESKAYEKTVLLKQGGYNYLYLFLPQESTKGSLQRIEGSHWETENEYAIYVYQRGFGDRYDKLIAVKILQSGK